LKCNKSIVNECLGDSNDLDATVLSENDNEGGSKDKGHESEKIDEKRAAHLLV